MDHDRTGDEQHEPEQTWGQGVGGHEPTLPEDGDERQDDETTPGLSSAYSDGTASPAAEPGALSRENEGMDR